VKLRIAFVMLVALVVLAAILGSLSEYHMLGFVPTPVRDYRPHGVPLGSWWDGRP
jgi:hypothetical protein